MNVHIACVNIWAITTSYDKQSEMIQPIPGTLWQVQSQFPNLKFSKRHLHERVYPVLRAPKGNSLHTIAIFKKNSKEET